jgi:hypothetical protein
VWKQLLAVAVTAMLSSGCVAAPSEDEDDLAEESSELLATKRLFAGEGAYLLGSWRSRVLFARQVSGGIEVHVASRSRGDAVLGVVPRVEWLRVLLERDGHFVLRGQSAGGRYADCAIIDLSRSRPTLALVPGTEFVRETQLSARGDLVYALQRRAEGLDVFLRRSSGLTSQVRLPSALASNVAPFEITDDGQHIMVLSNEGVRHVHDVASGVTTALPGVSQAAARAGNRLYAALPRRDGGSDVADVTEPRAPVVVFEHALHPVSVMVARRDGLLTLGPEVQLIDPVARRSVARLDFWAPSVAKLDRQSRLSPDGEFFVTWQRGEAWVSALKPSGFVPTRLMDGILDSGHCRFEGAFVNCRRTFEDANERVFMVRTVVQEVHRTARAPLGNSSRRHTCWTDRSMGAPKNTLLRCVNDVGQEMVEPLPYGGSHDASLGGRLLLTEVETPSFAWSLVAFDPATRARETLFVPTCAPTARRLEVSLSTSRLFVADCSGVYAR